MRYQLPTAILFALTAAVQAVPAPQSSSAPSTPFQYRQLTFSLNGAEGQNSVITIPADGGSHNTSKIVPLHITFYTILNKYRCNVLSFHDQSHTREPGLQHLYILQLLYTWYKTNHDW